MLEPRDEGLRALAMLQSGILSVREMRFEGYDMRGYAEQFVSEYVDSLVTLDRYLTGKTENRRPADDERMFLGLLTTDTNAEVYLSDGGYSRIWLDVADGHPVRLTRNSLARVAERWEALFPL